MGGDAHNGNGNGKRTGALAPDHIVLDYDPATDRLNIGGAFYSLDRALDILARATRSLEQQWRLAELARKQAEAMETARVQGILNRSHGRG